MQLFILSLNVTIACYECEAAAVLVDNHCTWCDFTVVLIFYLSNSTICELSQIQRPQFSEWEHRNVNKHLLRGDTLLSAVIFLKS